MTWGSFAQAGPPFSGEESHRPVEWYRRSYAKARRKKILSGEVRVCKTHASTCDRYHADAPMATAWPARNRGISVYHTSDWRICESCSLHFPERVINRATPAMTSHQSYREQDPGHGHFPGRVVPQTLDLDGS
jgi:hypothetical protein